MQDLPNFLSKLHQYHQSGWIGGVSVENSIAWFNGLHHILFPQADFSVQEIRLKWESNQHLFTTLLKDIRLPQMDVDLLTEQLYSKIPAVYHSLQQDATALLQNDPAATSIPEIISSYPGFFAIVVYRIAHTIAALSIPSIPRILTEYAHSKTGIDIHPSADIDVPFIIDHGTGIVIGETARIGKNVQLYQGVTIGALWVEKNLELKKRHPTVEHNVVIYANATILGGNTVIGNNSVIGGNTFITKSVNPYSMVQQSSKQAVIDKEELNKNISFNI